MKVESKISFIIIASLIVAVAIEIFIISSGKNDVGQLKNKSDETVFFQSERITEIKAELTSCDMKFLLWDEDKIEIAISSKRNQNDRPYAFLQNNTVIITEDKDIPNNNDNTFIEIKVPYNMIAEKNRFYIVAKTTNGNINIKDFYGAEFTVLTTTGKVFIDDCMLDNLYVNTVSGQIICNNITTDEIIATTESAQIRFIADCKSFTATSKKGGINFEAINIIESANLACENGTINITLPENDGFTAIYNIEGGKFVDDFTSTNTTENGKVIYKNGSASINIKAKDGNINILKNKNS